MVYRMWETTNFLIALVFEAARHGLAWIGKGVEAVVDVVRVIVRRPASDGQTVRTANRVNGSSTRNGRPALSDEVVARGIPVIGRSVEYLVAGLACCARWGLAIGRGICRRISEFRRDGKVELTRRETVAALLSLSSVGFLLAWLVADTDPRDPPLVDPPPAMDAASHTDPNATAIPSISARKLAHLLVERPDLEGKLSWAEEPIPLPMQVTIAEPKAGMLRVNQPVSVPPNNVAEYTVAGATATDLVPPPSPVSTSDAKHADTETLPVLPTMSSGKPGAAGEQSPARLPPSPVDKAETAAKIPAQPASRPGNEERPTPKVPAVATPAPRSAPSAGTSAGSVRPYQVQLVALGARDEAWKMWERLLDKHQDLLGDLEPDISSRRTRKSNLVYRLRAGPIDSRSEASALCAVLSKRNVDCLVVRASG